MQHNMSFDSADVYYMTLAIEEAKKGELTTRPNPAVGCVLVKDGGIIGKGFHPRAGMPHAEVFALRDTLSSGHEVRGATAYVTLEPCSHTGRTPPCADALIDAGVKKVVVACLDANPKVAGRGIKRLQEAGIEVVIGLCQEQAHELNRGFLKAMATGMPYVRLKMACSLDGKIAMASGESKWITGGQAREDVQRWRAKSSALVTGSGTILADDPALSVRSSRLGLPVDQLLQPKIVVVDRSHRLDTSSHYQVFDRPDTLIWRDDLPTLLKALVVDYQCYDVLVEAGSVLSGAFIQTDLVDELIIYQAPCILGASAQSMFDLNLQHLSDQRRFQLVDSSRVGQDQRMILRKYLN